jgi:hypothetical protein
LTNQLKMGVEQTLEASRVSSVLLAIYDMQHHTEMTIATSLYTISSSEGFLCLLQLAASQF